MISPLTLLLFFITLFVQIVAEDYYRILNIPRTANTRDIKKGFKKLAIKYHPDKNKDNPDKAKKIFQKISNAYEILSDPEQKKIYDQYGEEGLKQHAANKGGGGGFNPFQNFGGGGFKFHMGGGGGFHQEGGQSNEKWFGNQNENILEIEMNTIQYLFRRRELWYVLFYKPQDPKSRQVKEEFKLLSEKMHGIFKFGGVNCEAEEEICEENVVFEYPKLLLFTENSNIEPIIYPWKFKYNQIIQFADQKMQDFCDIVTDTNSEAYLWRAPDRLKVLLFSNRKSNPPLFKALSSKYSKSFSFGFVRQSEIGLAKALGITTYPKLIILNKNEMADPIVYEGEMKWDSITNFIRNYTYEKIVAIRKEKMVIYTNREYSNNHCLLKDKNICIFFFSNKEDSISITEINSVIPNYVNEDLSFYMVFIPTQLSFLEQFLPDNYDDNIVSDGAFVERLIIYRGQKKRFAEITSQPNETLIANDITIFFDNLLSGNLRFKRLNEPLIGPEED